MREKRKRNRDERKKREEREKKPISLSLLLLSTKINRYPPFFFLTWHGTLGAGHPQQFPTTANMMTPAAAPAAGGRQTKEEKEKETEKQGRPKPRSLFQIVAAAILGWSHTATPGGGGETQ